MGISIIAIICAVLFFILFAASKRTTFKTVCAWICFVIFGCAVILSVINEHHYLGMTKETSVKEVKIASLSPQINVLKQINVDKAGHKIIVYKDKDTNKIKKTTLDTNYQVELVKDQKYTEPLLKVKETRYVYQNAVMEFLFKYPGQKLKPVKVVETFYLDPNFQIQEQNGLKEMKK